jgi:uncharacterized membrane protein
METWAIARALHVLGVIFWIGGVAMVTTVLLPAVAEFRSEGDRVAFFDRVERRFAAQSRYSTLLVGATGFYMVHALGLWPRFSDYRFWWMHAMVFVWALFTLMLFVLEPLFLHRWLSERARRDDAGTFRHVLRLHRVLLALSIITAAGAVAGVHGLLIP